MNNIVVTATAAGVLALSASGAAAQPPVTAPVATTQPVSVANQNGYSLVILQPVKLSDAERRQILTAVGVDGVRLFNSERNAVIAYLDKEPEYRATITQALADLEKNLAALKISSGLTTADKELLAPFTSPNPTVVNHQPRLSETKLRALVTKVKNRAQTLTQSFRTRLAGLPKEFTHQKAILGVGNAIVLDAAGFKLIQDNITAALARATKPEEQQLLQAHLQQARQAAQEYAARQALWGFQRGFETAVFAHSQSWQQVDNATAAFNDRRRDADLHRVAINLYQASTGSAQPSRLSELIQAAKGRTAE